MFDFDGILELSADVALRHMWLTHAESVKERFWWSRARKLNHRHELYLARVYARHAERKLDACVSWQVDSGAWQTLMCEPVAV